MEKIHFYNTEDHITYEGVTDFVSKNVISITFNNILPLLDSEISQGFEIRNENNDYVQAIYADYNTLYRTYDDNPQRIDLSNDGSIYIPPTPPAPPEEDEPYVPTLEELEMQFQENKARQIGISKIMLAKFLGDNPIHSTAHNNTEGIYSITSEKQTLMMSQYMTYQIEKSVNPNAKLTWNETGKSCEDWTEEEFLRLILEVKAYVYPLVSYQQRIEEEIINCNTQEELDGVVIDYNSVVQTK